MLVSWNVVYENRNTGKEHSALWHCRTKKNHSVTGQYELFSHETSPTIELASARLVFIVTEGVWK